MKFKSEKFYLKSVNLRERDGINYQNSLIFIASYSKEITYTVTKEKKTRSDIIEGRINHQIYYNLNLPISDVNFLDIDKLE